MQFQRLLFTAQSTPAYEDAQCKRIMYVRDGAGMRVAHAREVFACAAELAAEPETKREILDSPQASINMFKLRLHPALEHEVFAVAFLDSKHQVIAYLEPFRGTLTQAAVYPREIVKLALQHNAAAVIVAHNHPSGSLEPSAADLALTKTLANALALIDCKLLDHILVAEGQTLSFAQRGLM